MSSCAQRMCWAKTSFWACFGRVLVEIIQPAFPDGLDLGVAQQLEDALAAVFGLMGMHAGGGPHPVVFACHLDGFLGVGQVGARSPGNAALLRRALRPASRLIRPAEMWAVVVYPAGSGCCCSGHCSVVARLLFNYYSATWSLGNNGSPLVTAKPPGYCPHTAASGNFLLLRVHRPSPRRPQASAAAAGNDRAGHDGRHPQSLQGVAQDGAELLAGLQRPGFVCAGNTRWCRAESAKWHPAPPKAAPAPTPGWPAHRPAPRWP